MISFGIAVNILYAYMYNLYIACYHRTKYLHVIYEYIPDIFNYIPETQMTLLLVGKDLVLEGPKLKIEDKQSNRFQVYIYIMLYVNVYADYVNFYIDDLMLPDHPSTPGWVDDWMIPNGRLGVPF